MKLSPWTLLNDTRMYGRKFSPFTLTRRLGPTMSDRRLDRRQPRFRRPEQHVSAIGKRNQPDDHDRHDRVEQIDAAEQPSLFVNECHELCLGLLASRVREASVGDARSKR